MSETRTCGGCEHMGRTPIPDSGLHQCAHPQHKGWPCTWPLTEPDVDATNCPGYTPRSGKEEKGE